MYINSDFSDYYDFCTKYGQDPKIVYNRKTSAVKVPAKIGHSIDYNNNLDPQQFLRTIYNVICELNHSRVYCRGRWTHLYPISFYCIGGHPYFLIHETNTTLSFSEAWDYMKSKRKEKNSLFSNYSTAVLSNFGSLCVPEKLMQLHAYLHAPIFGIDFYIRESPNACILNPCLKAIKFPEDPVVVYTLIFNSLQTPEPKMLEVQDSYKALAHGMDSGSFKREPGGPTRKRKKIIL
jgi:hypothetical protein